MCVCVCGGGGGWGGLKGTLKREALGGGGGRSGGMPPRKNFKCKSSKMGENCLKIGYRM